MMNPLSPSRNPTNNDSMVGMFRVVLSKFLQSFDDMLPGQVIAFDRTTGMAQVQPLISILTTDNTILQRAPILSVPVLQIGGGGFMLNFPIKPNDLGWIKANDRDISLFKQSWVTSPPNTSRKHDFGDAIFIPHVLTNFTINSEDAANAVLSSVDGTVRIAIWDNQIKITAPKVIIDSPTTTITGTLEVQGAVTLDQTLHVKGNTTEDGTLVVSGQITGNGIALSTHVHSGVQTGGGDTGPPV